MSRAPIESIDVVIGKRLRALRNEKKVSQGKLGEDVGISFQQVQKYERGANRISASRLYTIARALGVGVSYFYEDFAAGVIPLGMAEDGEGYRAGPGVDGEEARQLLAAFARIDNASLRASVLNMARSLADSREGGRSDGPAGEPGASTD